MPYAVVFFVMLVVLATMLFQVKARIVMARGAGKPLTKGQKLRRYLIMTGVWALITAGVMAFVRSKLR